MKKTLHDYLEIHYCAAFFVYSTAFLTFFWELHSLLFRFRVSDILGFFSYQLMFALFESVLLSGVVTFLVCLIPFRNIKEHRSVAGGLFIICFAISGLVFKERRELLGWLHAALELSPARAQQAFAFLWLFPLLGLPAISLISIRSDRFVRQFEWFLQNLAVLAGAYTVISLLGIAIVVFRNLA